MSCPICKKPTVAQYRPFCSKRCADIDLGKWLGGEYTLADEETEASEEVILEHPKKGDPLH